MLLLVKDNLVYKMTANLDLWQLSVQEACFYIEKNLFLTFLMMYLNYY